MDKYHEDFEALKRSENFDNYNEFIERYPGTPHANELSKALVKHNADRAELERTVAQAKAERERLDEIARKEQMEKEKIENKKKLKKLFQNS